MAETVNQLLEIRRQYWAQEQEDDTASNSSDPSYVPSSGGEESDKQQQGKIKPIEEIATTSSNVENAENNQERKRHKVRVRQPISKSRQERKAARNQGAAYETASGKSVPEKKPVPLNIKCKKKCFTRITPESCSLLCDEVWKGLGDQNLRSTYIADRVEVVPKGSQTLKNVSPSRRKNRTFTMKYHVTVNGSNIDVCKGCFMDIYAVSAKFIEVAVGKKMKNPAGVVSKDGRGMSSHPLADSKLQEVIDHLNSFPKYKSHYARNKTDKQFLPNHLTAKIMYAEYCKAVDEPVSRWIYEREFHKLDLKIKPFKIDTCHTCDKLAIAIGYSKTEEERQKNLKLQEEHHCNWEKARDQKIADNELAKNDKKKHVITFDLQQCLPTPFLNTSIVFYKRQLWVYNLTIHVSGTNDSIHNMWDESEAARGANQVGSALYIHLMSLPDYVEEAVLWSDTCGGQNKNSIIVATLQTVLHLKKTLKKIDQKFLVPGHTHLDCDSDHAIIEDKKKKAINIHLPRDWYTLVRNASPKFTVQRMTQDHQLNFSSMSKGRNSPLVRRKKDTTGEKFLWRNVVWMQHRRNLPCGVLCYKTTLDEETAFSFLDIRRKKKEPTVLNPELAYDGPLKISAAKKADLVSMLHLIDPDARPYYLRLNEDANLEDFDPDILPSSDEEESADED